jgi:hypothetical protein
MQQQVKKSKSKAGHLGNNEGSISSAKTVAGVVKLSSAIKQMVNPSAKLYTARRATKWQRKSQT